MKTILLKITMICMFSSLSNAKNYEDIIKKTDIARGKMPGGLSWTVHITSSEAGKINEMEMTVKAKDDNAIAEATSPARSKGEVYLFIDNSIWFSKPSLKKPVVISSRLRLSGQAVSGDIASTNYSRDYSVTLDKETKDEYIFRLKSKNSSTTYDQILYTVNKKQLVATKADFLTVSGEVFKRADFKYGYSLKNKGKSTPFISEMKIQDTKSSDYSILKYKNPKIEKISDQIFKVSSITR